jgi:hypothetical protein
MIYKFHGTVVHVYLEKFLERRRRWTRLSCAILYSLAEIIDQELSTHLFLLSAALIGRIGPVRIAQVPPPQVAAPPSLDTTSRWSRVGDSQTRARRFRSASRRGPRSRLSEPGGLRKFLPGSRHRGGRRSTSSIFTRPVCTCHGLARAVPHGHYHAPEARPTRVDPAGAAGRNRPDQAGVAGS